MADPLYSYYQMTETTITESQRMLLRWVKESFKAYRDAEREIKPKKKKKDK